MSSNLNNLTELNNILFDTLRGVKDGKVEPSKAEAISKISASVVNNAKVMLQAVKIVEGMSLDTNVFGGSIKNNLLKDYNEDDLHQIKLKYAADKGYKSLGEALVTLGKEGFDSQLNDWLHSKR